jgi:hypothetical protein
MNPFGRACGSFKLFCPAGRACPNESVQAGFTFLLDEKSKHEEGTSEIKSKITLAFFQWFALARLSDF